MYALKTEDSQHRFLKTLTPWSQLITNSAITAVRFGRWPVGEMVESAASGEDAADGGRLTELSVASFGLVSL
ncbi:hypothetical protein [Lacipirellula sp.]|uniref:hypothetical protein n=1 Tax=Lacipirellula sp. TaxID=2691419 RepID=UPI003D1178D8